MEVIYKKRYEIILSLLCISNILNIFLNRGSTGVTEETGGSRVVIHIINAAALAMMILSLAEDKTPKVYLWLKLLLAIIIAHFVIHFYVTVNFSKSINQYIRLITNLFAFIVFFNGFSKQQKSGLRSYVQVYCCTLLTSSIAKIMSSSMFNLESLGAGDTASIAIVFLIPLFFLFFDTKWGTVLYLIGFAFTLVSMRRTCILAYIASFPFIYSYLKRHISIGYLFSLAIVATILGYQIWERIGTSLVYRFNEATTGNEGSYGSGRSVFYTLLFDDFFKRPSGQLFGNGLFSVWEYYESKSLTYLPHAHNDLLELLYTFGFAGLSLWIYFLFSLTKFSLNKHAKKSNRKTIILAIVIYTIVALASGTLLRIEMLPLTLTLSYLAASK